jgi:hypothetical protein
LGHEEPGTFANVGDIGDIEKVETIEIKGFEKLQSPPDQINRYRKPPGFP